MSSLRRAPRGLARSAWQGNTGGHRAARANSRSWIPFLAILLGLFLVPFSPVRASDWSDRNEGEGSLPFTADLGTGTVIAATWGQIGELGLNIHGPGTLEVIELDPGNPDAVVLFAFRGNLVITLDREALANSPATIHFSAGSALFGGMAQADLDQHCFAPFTLDQMTYELPIDALYAGGEVRPPRLGIQAMGPGLERYRFGSRAVGGAVVLVQRVRF